MRLPRLFRPVAVVLLIVWSSSSFGMYVRYRSLDDVIANSTGVVVANILDTPQIRDERFFHVLTVRVEIVSTLYGDTVAPGAYTCRYEEGRPHQRGSMHVWPLVSGSGMELLIEKNQRVILLLKHHPAPASECEVLRMEPIENRDAVETAGQHGCCRDETSPEHPAPP